MQQEHEVVKLIKENSNLSDVGHFLLQSDLYWATQVEHRKSQGLKRVPVVAPVFITGTGRTASSFLHANMRDTGFRVAQVYETYAMLRRTGQEMGHFIWSIDREIKLADEQSPEYAMVNPHQWNDPAEDIHFDRSNFGTPWWLSHYGGIFDWAANKMFADLKGEYEHQRDFAELLGRPGDRWCFRSVPHLMRLETLFEVFPDATVIWMERDPAQVEPGIFKMIKAMRLTRSAIVDEDEVRMLAQSAATIGPMMAEEVIAAGKVPIDQIIRVSFEDITENTEATMAYLMDRIGSPCLQVGESHQEVNTGGVG